MTVKHWLKQPKMLPSHIIVVECQKWRFTNYNSTPANNPSLTSVRMSPVLIKHTYPCLTYFIMTEHWLKQLKMLPSHIVVECQKWRCSNHLKTPAHKPSLTGVGMSLVQIKHTYLCLTALLWLNTGWSSQKCCPATLLLSAILWRCTNHLKIPANMPSLTGIGMSLDQVKYTHPCLTAFIMTEHWLKQPKMLTSHLHLLSAKNEGAPTTSKLLQKCLPWLV